MVAILTPGCKKDKPQNDPDRIDKLLSHRSLGLAYLEENQLDKAESEFKQIIEIAPDETFGYANLALTYLRKAQYGNAEEQIEKALQLSREPEVVLIQAEILERAGNASAAMKVLQNSVKTYPQHISSQYKLAQLYLRSSNSNRYQQAQESLAAVESAAPANLPAKLQLTEMLVRNDRPQEAILHLREVRQIVAGLPEGSAEHFTNALNALVSKKTQEALPSLIAFHNFIKPVPVYQAGVMELTGPGGPLMGFPVVHFSSKVSAQVQIKPLEHIRFVPTSQNPAPPIPRIRADYDNDGKMEVCEIRKASIAVIDDNGKAVHEIAGAFEGALFFDFDQDGDLDLYTIGESRALRNNGDQTFSDQTNEMLLRRNGRSSGALFGDFDDDGDLDLLVIDPVSGNTLYDNLRQGRFRIITTRAGLTGYSSAVTAGDYNSDGFLDLFVTGRRSFLLRNMQNGSFEPDRRSPVFNNLSGQSASFIDFDNDGFQDLVVGSDRLLLFRNNGYGVFTDATSVVPSQKEKIIHIEPVDRDSDGDLDLLVTDASRTTHLLRNDGGNANRWLKVSLQGLGTGSGKNNRTGIGAKLEVKAGALYQMRVVTEPVTHFGLGDRTGADVVRVVWTNGVPQNHMQPQSNQVLLEKQILKGSCPFVYAWNGTKFEFVTDIMWKSALGMPLGIMGASTAYAFPNSSDEFLRIAGSQLKARDGFYTLQITEELWETAYLDKTRLIAVDHPNTVEVFIDEKFVVPPFPPLKIYPVSQRIYPVSARNGYGVDVLSRIRSKDDLYAAQFEQAAYQGITDEQELILDLGRFDSSDTIVLFLRGWIFPSDASINVALSQSSVLKPVTPYLQVVDRKGKWQTVIPSMSFPMGKDKTMIVDLSGKFLSNDHRIRIRTSMEIYWDEIFYTKNEPAIPMRLTTLKPVSADLHYRGFSRTYRKNILGPHWFDYSDVDKTPKWRDLEGNYTRFGDVTPLLQESDSIYVIMNAGDEITIRFDEKQTPRVAKNWTRDFLLYSDGWIKDGDLNTAHSKTVDPLPFHGIKSYPYSPQDHYPTDHAHQDYLNKYNTRKVHRSLAPLQ